MVLVDSPPFRSGDAIWHHGDRQCGESEVTIGLYFEVDADG
jgi:hypothetical protein